MKKARILVPLIVFALWTPLFATPPDVNKAIIPIVGAVKGVNGAVFHTDIRIVGKPGVHGMLVFHPAGQIADDANDPSLPYTCAASGGCVELSVGGPLPFGIGSIDIIPDPTSDPTLPAAFTHIYSDIPNSPSVFPPSIEPFGSALREVVEADYVQRQGSAPAEQRFVYIPHGSPSVRRSVAIRTLTPLTYSVYFGTGPGAEYLQVKHATLPGNFTMMEPIEKFVDYPIGPDDDVRIVLESGSAIVSYAYTHNDTNEPSVTIAPAVEQSPALIPPTQ